MKRYGKSSGPLLALKASYFENNDALLQEKLGVAQLYSQQPPREACKNCDGPLGGADFTKHGVGYAICVRCGHLSGLHEDTDGFCEKAYTEDGGETYAAGYSAASKAVYDQRVEDIYVPKAEFLCDALRELSEEPRNLSFVDLGAGSGYFVAALQKLGISRIVGFEVSERQVTFANEMLEGAPLRRHSLADTVEIADTTEADVISMIGVLEHVQRPRQVLAALRDNSRVKYFFISVPLFSPSVFFEMVFPSVMPRQLTARHTHLFTQSSLAWMCREFQFEAVAEWWFGTDLVDLYRSVAVRMREDGQSRDVMALWDEFMVPSIDAMQVELDKRHLSSEVHMLLKAKR